MAAFYEVWDDSTGNRLGEFGSLDEARSLLSAILRESGPKAVRSLAVLSYTPTGPTAGPASGDYKVTTVLEGAALVTGVGESPARSTL
jgi:hypothetical protein